MSEGRLMWYIDPGILFEHDDEEEARDYAEQIGRTELTLVRVRPVEAEE